MEKWEIGNEGETSKRSPSYASTDVVMESGSEMQFEVCKQSLALMEHVEEIHQEEYKVEEKRNESNMKDFLCNLILYS